MRSGGEVYRQEPDGTVTETDHLDCRVGCLVTAPLATRGTRSGSSTETKYQDELGRDIATERESFSGADPILELTRYDSFDREVAYVRPHFATDPAPSPRSTEYDDLGRPTRILDPDLLETTYAYAMGRLGTSQERTTTRHDRVTIEWFDAVGQRVEVLDAEQNTTRFEYWPFGELAKTVDQLGFEYDRTYDERGRLRRIEDPDRGIWIFDYDGADNLVTEEDAEGDTTTMAYDPLDRPILRTDSEGTTVWEYDTARWGLGLLAQVTMTAPDYTRRYHFDALSRPSWSEVRIAERRFATLQTYDDQSRVRTLAYPSGLEVQYDRNPRGYLTAIGDTATGEPLWRAQEVDALGRLRAATLGADGPSAVTLAREFDPVSELPVSIAATRGTVELGTFGYDFDENRDLETRTANDPVNGFRSEDFSHDRLGRITGSGGSSPAKTYGYDSVGSMSSRSDVGTYVPNPSRPHRVAGIPELGIEYQYDANGAQWQETVDGETRTIAWKPFHKIGQISTSALTKLYAYGPDRELVRETSTEGGVTDTFYIDGLYELVVVNGAVAEEKSWVAAERDVVALVTESSPGMRERSFTVKDHLGSTSLIIDESGAVADYLSYGPFGELRNADWSDAPGLLEPSDASWDRLFTGQRYVHGIGIYDFGARFYDPKLGRFLSPDPLVADPADSRSLDPFAYTEYSPLTSIDPTGMLGFSIRFSFGKNGDLQGVSGGTESGQSSDSNDQADSADQIDLILDQDDDVASAAIATPGEQTTDSDLSLASMEADGDTPGTLAEADTEAGVGEVLWGGLSAGEILGAGLKALRATSIVGMLAGIATMPGQPRGSNEVIFDTNLVLNGSLFNAGMSRLAPGQTPVITPTIAAEAAFISKEKGLRTVSEFAALPVVPDVFNPVAASRLQTTLTQLGATGRGLLGDVIIGTTGISTMRQVFTNDVRFNAAITESFGGGRSVLIRQP